MGGILYNTRIVINLTDFDFNVSIYSQYPIITNRIKSKSSALFDFSHFSEIPTITGIIFKDSLNTLQLEYFSNEIQEPNFGFFLQSRTITIVQDENTKFNFSLSFYEH
ncbi:hypothetical protein BDE27_1829 [Xenorhabdus ehlersii]|uniref:Uncharacterized protein n=1 Tax=Xenorhabdus ehlersii TaxID=290111 RepID=A0A2D0IWP4_9GAMM|nr:hypothetical protein [Xenorhabdus sp. TS4]PHM26324.1 hypothetical protein Xehl_00656 [Xenorhabdus ehlersii]RKE91573.1 hypothetical protein BDE27_1829 [Xenorhabdus ehlersii]